MTMQSEQVPHLTQYLGVWPPDVKATMEKQRKISAILFVSYVSIKLRESKIGNPEVRAIPPSPKKKQKCQESVRQSFGV